MVVPKPADVSDSWIAFWTTGWDWTVTKAQIDHAIGFGANTIRVGMPTGCVITGLNKATAETNLRTFCAYLQSAGLLFYPSLRGGAGDWAGASIGTVAVAYSEVLGIVVPYGNVCAVEAVNEINLAAVDTATAQGWMGVLAPYITAAAPGTPIAVSIYVSSAADLTDATWVNALRTYVDFYDFHPYYGGLGGNATNPVNSDFTAYRAMLGYKQFLLGECGISASAPTQQSRITSIGTLSAAASDCYGAVGFCVNDYDSNHLGVYDDTGANPRATWLAGIATWPHTP